MVRVHLFYVVCENKKMLREIAKSIDVDMNSVSDAILDESGDWSTKKRGYTEGWMDELDYLNDQTCYNINFVEYRTRQEKIESVLNIQTTLEI